MNAAVEQTEIVATIRDWVDREVIPVASDLEHADEFPTELVAQMPSLADGGDFTNMIVDDAPGLAFVQHEATMQWDEQGTVATAATAGGFADSYQEYPRVDHPFLFFLRDDLTGMVLFQGRVVDPSAS